MRFVRTILAFAVAVSLAVLPIGTSSAGRAMSSGDVHSSMSMTGGAMSMDDCCPDDMKGTNSHTDGFTCGAGFCCAGATPALGGFQVQAFEVLIATAGKIAIPSDQVVDFHGGSPPFRPPRI